MRIVLAVLVLNQQEVTQKFLDQLRSTETKGMPIYIVDNGSNPPVRDWLLGLKEGDIVIRNGENEGVVKGMNQVWTVAKNVADYIFYIHNDVMIYEKGWDEKLERILTMYPDTGVAGFYGAKGIGTPDIYRSGYAMHQMIRVENVSGCHRMDAVHGYRPPRNGEIEDVAVMDGFSLIVKTELLNDIGGFDRNYPPHHMYDNDICLESLDKGYVNRVIAMDAQHLGGRTDVGENWAEKFGKTKAEIHKDAHPVFYKKWAPDMMGEGKHTIKLPVRVQ